MGKDSATIKLNNGVEMPMLGLGVSHAQEEYETEQAVMCALEAGYRHIDAAAAFGNEQSVGKGIKQSGVERDEIFIVTKLSGDSQRQGRQYEAVGESLRRLGVEYVDLLLMHWPIEDSFTETWRLMERVYREGRARAIGVSNCLPRHVEEILKVATVTPAVNQIELHPLLPQNSLKAYLDEKNIVAEAYSPIARGLALSDDRIRALAERYHKTPAQVVLRWAVQRGVPVIPKSVKRHRIYENAELFDFSLSPRDMALIDTMNSNARVGFDSENHAYPPPQYVM